MLNRRNRISRIKKIITTASIIALATVILFICVEVFIGILHAGKREIDDRRKSAQSISKDDAWNLEYSPWAQFKTVDKHSAYLNAAGFFRKSQPDTCGDAKESEDGIYDIYFFGGSTMYGVNVSDGETIPSHFAAILGSENKKIKARVWNCGQPYYYSTQELFLLFSMIVEGRRPKAVVFLDGLNDILQPGSSYNRYPFFTPALKELFLEQSQFSAAYLLTVLFQKTNIYRALKLSGLISISSKSKDIRYASYWMPPNVSEDEVAHKILKNYINTIKTTQTLCNAFNIKCYFFWQPVPYYNYDRSKDSICDKRSFPLFAKTFPVIKNEADHTSDLYYLGDLLLEYKGPAFVDSFHYSSSFNRLIAEKMLQVISFPDVSSSN